MENHFSSLNSLFPQFSDLFTSENLRMLVRKEVKRGAYLCRAGEPLRDLLFITGGRCRVFRGLYDGKELLLRIFRPGEIVGDVEFFLRTSAICSVQATGPGEYAAFPLQQLRHSADNCPETLFALGSSLAKKVQENSTAEAVNLSYPLQSRLAAYVLAYGGTSLQADSLTELALWFGCSYRHLSRTLSSLAERGLLKKEGRGIIAVDPRQLRQLAGDVPEEGTLKF